VNAEGRKPPHPLKPHADDQSTDARIGVILANAVILADIVEVIPPVQFRQGKGRAHGGPSVGRLSANTQEGPAISATVTASSPPETGHARARIVAAGLRLGALLSCEHGETVPTEPELPNLELEAPPKE